MKFISIASTNDHDEIVELLLQHKVDPYKQDKISGLNCLSFGNNMFKGKF